jgi:hypothetical protein
MPESATTLIFAYRAERGIFNSLSHTMHRVFSPATYECRLCQITFSAVGMLRPWKDFLESRPEAKRFYHRKEFVAAYPQVTAELPLILKTDPDSPSPEILLGREEIENCDDVDELIDKLIVKLDADTTANASSLAGSSADRNPH